MQTHPSTTRKSTRASRQTGPAPTLAIGPTLAAAGVSPLQQARKAALQRAELGHLGEGLLMLREVMEQQPPSHEVVSDIAALLLVARQHELAAHYALDALVLKPNHGPSLYVLGFALSGMGDTERAREALVQLLAGASHDSLMREAPALLPVVQAELQRLARLPH